MPISIDIDLSLLNDSLLIKLNRSISTLESNYYINNVCLAYSKLLCLEGICSALLQYEKIKCKINEYEFERQESLIIEPREFEGASTNFDGYTSHKKYENILVEDNQHTHFYFSGLGKENENFKYNDILSRRIDFFLKD